jgi:hypothetical protein
VALSATHSAFDAIVCFSSSEVGGLHHEYFHTSSRPVVAETIFCVPQGSQNHSPIREYIPPGLGTFAVKSRPHSDIPQDSNID